MEGDLIKDIQEKLFYDDLSGTLRWVKNGKSAGYKSKSGYVQIRVNDKLYYAHRLIFVIKTGEWPTGFVDHKDRNPANNTWDNLRVGTQSDNMKNSTVRPFKTSEYKGVSWRSDTKNWTVRIRVFEKYLGIGSFKSEQEAALAYNKAAKNYYGEWANLNTIKGTNERFN